MLILKVILTKSFSDFEFEVRAATDKGEWDPGDGDVRVWLDDVIRGICWCKLDEGIRGPWPVKEPPNEHKAAAELIRPRLPPGEVR